MEALDPTLQGIIIGVAVVLFVVAAFPDEPFAHRLRFIAAGLALFAFPFAWNAFAAG